LKFHTAPLRGKLRNNCVALEFYDTLLGGEFCVTLARCFGILRCAKRRLNLKFAFGKTFKIKPEFYQLAGGLTVTNFTWTI